MTQNMIVYRTNATATPLWRMTSVPISGEGGTIVTVLVIHCSSMILVCCSYLSHLMTKPTKWSVRSAKTQISLGICPVWSESSLSAWRKLGSIATHWAHSEDSDQTGRMPRLIWVFAGRSVILLVLSWSGSFQYFSRMYFYMYHTNIAATRLWQRKQCRWFL